MKQTCLQKPGLALITGWFFVLLLVSSAPHRVHHAFEDLRFSQKSNADAATSSEGHTHAHDNSEHDNHGHEHNSGGSTKADCVTQAVAQNFHFASAQATEVSYLELESETRPAVTLAPRYNFSLSPFSQRAPPQA